MKRITAETVSSSKGLRIRWRRNKPCNLKSPKKAQLLANTNIGRMCISVPHRVCRHKFVNKVEIGQRSTFQLSSYIFNDSILCRNKYLSWRCTPCVALHSSPVFYFYHPFGTTTPPENLNIIFSYLGKTKTKLNRCILPFPFRLDAIVRCAEKRQCYASKQRTKSAKQVWISTESAGVRFAWTPAHSVPLV